MPPNKANAPNPIKKITAITAGNTKMRQRIAFRLRADALTISPLKSREISSELSSLSFHVRHIERLILTHDVLSNCTVVLGGVQGECRQLQEVSKPFLANTHIAITHIGP
jgi:hypothetical protein